MRSTMGRPRIPISQRQLEEATEQDNDPTCPAPGAWGRRKIPVTQQQLAEAMEQDDEPGYPAPGIRERRMIPISQEQLKERMDQYDEPTCPRLDEPSYEYSHDHSDQHDDPPTPKREHFATSTHHAAKGEDWEQEHETEMDAYERLESASTLSLTRFPPIPAAQSSILSTLTTTERSVAPDGSVTTKLVLKKRFADGREESSETVHRQRGQEDGRTRDPWRALQGPSAPAENQVQTGEKKSSGWFWSS
jgi:hypothetical protein